MGKERKKKMCKHLKGDVFRRLKITREMGALKLFLN